jgi:uridine kinase
MNARAAGESPLLVGIAGGSGSGKSSLARALVAALGPGQAVLLRHEAYYRDRPVGDGEGTAVSYDVPDALDQPLFLEHLAGLRAGRTIRPPTYSFASHRRAGEGLAVVPRAIVIVEGVLLLWDPVVRAALDLKIYLDAPEDVRIERRLRLDGAGSRRTTDDVLRQFTTAVREAHRSYVEPTRTMADLVLATAGPLQPITEIAVAVVLDRLARRRGARLRLAS